MRSLLERSLRLTFLPGKPGPGFAQSELYNDCYRFWSGFWEAVYRDLGEKTPPAADHFTRQDCLALLTHGRQIVAFHGYTFYDVDYPAQREHSYFTQAFSAVALARLAQRATYVMTMEYLSVHPDWRASKTGVSLPIVLAQLALRYGESHGAQALLGIGRQDSKVDQRGLELGGMFLESNVKVHGVPCSLIALFPGETHPYHRAEENDLAAALWEGRTDTTTPAIETLPQRQAA
jgi:hypothetical protein